MTNQVNFTIPQLCTLLVSAVRTEVRQWRADRNDLVRQHLERVRRARKKREELGR